MGKKSVRQGIAAYLAPGVSSITHLGTVYQALPKVANEADLFLFEPPGSGLGAAIYLFVEDQQERRIALGGTHGGRKERLYTIGLLCILKSDLQTAQDGQDAFDDFIDSLTAYIEADRTAGGAVWQWGEGNTQGAPDVRFEFPVPRTRHGGVMLFQGVGRVTAIEMLNT